MEKCEVCGNKFKYKNEEKICQVCGKKMCIPCQRMIHQRYESIFVCGECYGMFDSYLRQIDDIVIECEARTEEVWKEARKLIKYE